MTKISKLHRGTGTGAAAAAPGSTLTPSNLPTLLEYENLDDGLPSRQAGRQASRQTGRQTSNRTISSLASS